MDAKERLIIALDVETRRKALDLMDELKGDVKFFKIGLELFSSCGPDIVREAAKAGSRIFLDLKYHDIPNTVARAAASVTALGAYMLNVHALGGYDMMKKAASAVRDEAAKLNIEPPKIIAVTILTSMDEIALKRIGVSDNMADEVLKLAMLAKEAGLDGVVASPSETSMIRRAIGEDFLIVTPGVRPSWAAAQDQKRIATPGRAVSDGASFIVVGRPVTEAKDRREAARKVLEEIGL